MAIYVRELFVDAMTTFRSSSVAADMRAALRVRRRKPLLQLHAKQFPPRLGPRRPDRSLACCSSIFGSPEFAASPLPPPSPRAPDRVD